MMGMVVFSFFCGLIALACLVCAVLFIRRWHRRELGGDKNQWYSVRKIMAQREAVSRSDKAERSGGRSSTTQLP
jgi:hypothetical protein